MQQKPMMKYQIEQKTNHSDNLQYINDTEIVTCGMLDSNGRNIEPLEKPDLQEKSWRNKRPK
jgi:hypothetical protein